MIEHACVYIARLKSGNVEVYKELEGNNPSCKIKDESVHLGTDWKEHWHCFLRVTMTLFLSNSDTSPLIFWQNFHRTKGVEMKPFNLLGAYPWYPGLMTPDNNAIVDGIVHNEIPKWIKTVMNDVHFLPKGLWSVTAETEWGMLFFSFTALVTLMDMMLKGWKIVTVSYCCVTSTYKILVAKWGFISQTFAAWLKWLLWPGYGWGRASGHQSGWVWWWRGDCSTCILSGSQLKVQQLSKGNSPHIDDKKHRRVSKTLEAS